MPPFVGGQWVSPPFVVVISECFHKLVASVACGYSLIVQHECRHLMVVYGAFVCLRSLSKFAGSDDCLHSSMASGKSPICGGY